MEGAILPQHIIEHILIWVPVKSLLRFTCVSKTLHSLILSDPKFAKSQLQVARDRKTLTHRLLFASNEYNRKEQSFCDDRFKSIDHQTPSTDEDHFPSIVLPCEYDQTMYVWLFGSCNGIVLLGNKEKKSPVYYLWNPSIRFFKELHNPGFLSNTKLLAWGIGYLSATDDLRVFFLSSTITRDEQGSIYSSRLNAWKNFAIDGSRYMSHKGTLLKEALHWYCDYSTDSHHRIIAFDLAQEKCKEMMMPLFFHDLIIRERYSAICLGDSAQGCLSVALYRQDGKYCVEYVDIWVMKEYGVRDSWTRLYDIKLLHPLDGGRRCTREFVMETNMATGISIDKLRRGLGVIIQHERGYHSDITNMVRYEESLLRIHSLEHVVNRYVFGNCGVY